MSRNNKRLPHPECGLPTRDWETVPTVEIRRAGDGDRRSGGPIEGGDRPTDPPPDVVRPDIHDTVHDSEFFGIRVRARSRMILTFTPLVIVVYVPYVMHATEFNKELL